MNEIIAVIDDDQGVLDEVEKILKRDLKGVTVIAFRPEQLGTLPTKADVFVVDFDMGAISGSEIVRKIRELQKETIIIVWGVPLDPSGEEKISLFEAGANFIIDKYIENIATVVRTALKEVLRKRMFPQEFRAARGF